MDKELAVEKINKIGKAGKIVVRIGKIFAILGLTMCLALFIVLLFLPKDSISYKTSSDFQLIMDMYKLSKGELNDIDINKTSEFFENDLNISVDNELYEDVNAKIEGDNILIDAGHKSSYVDIRRSGIKVTILGMIYIALVLVTLFFLESVFKTIEKCESPFSDEVVRNLNKFAFSLIPWIFVGTLRSGIMSAFGVGSTRTSFTVDIGSLILVLVVFALAYIFKYGAVLQQESDETL